MMGPSPFRGGIGTESFGVDRYVRGFSLDAQSFVSLRLAIGAASAYIRSPKVARSVRIAAALQFGFVGFDSFRIPTDVCLVL
ncbi:MAG TPA: hypothetical protein VEX43_04120 [Chthoniobacterales bacterium]|nr:hypothetical protein [Chthoniobacterales bacterium]